MEEREAKTDMDGVDEGRMLQVCSEYIGQVGKISVSEYSDRRFKPRLQRYVVSLSMTLNPHCFSRLSCEMSTRRGHSHEGCLLSAMSFPEEIALKNQLIFEQ